MRADKWLWAVRVFRTRTLATEACRGNLVKIDGDPIKPSRELKTGEVVEIEKEIAVRACKVLDFPAARVSAKVVDSYRENLSPEPEKGSRLDFLEFPVPRRDRGQGRPTKRERRQMDSWLGDPGES